MTRASPIVRFQRLGPKRRRLLMRAAYTLSLASAAVALLPFRRAIRFGYLTQARYGDRLDAADCVWAIEAAARRLPWRTVCIQKGLAVQRLLRRTGADARLHYGARRDESSGELEAHVWVTVDGAMVIGGEEAARFNEIAVYP